MDVVASVIARRDASIRAMPSDLAPPSIQLDPLPYVPRLETRSPRQADLVVIHCTELPDLATAREFGERIVHPGSQTGNSGHFYIDRDGAAHCWVPVERIAHHVRGYNPRSIGIELVNTGRYPDWLDSRRQVMAEAYPDAQIAALVALLQHLQAQHPSLAAIAGHEDLDSGEVPASDNPTRMVRRKLDPGPMFPWQQVLMATAFTRLP